MKLDHAHHLRAADLEGLAAEAVGLERGKRDRFGEIAHIDGLEIAVRRDHREDGQARHRSEAVGEVILGAEHERGPDDRRGREGLAKRRLALALGAAVAGLGVWVGGDRRDVDERARACLARRLGDVARTLDVGPVHRAAEDAAQVDDGGRALDRVFDAAGVHDVGDFETELPDLRERLDAVGLTRVALCDSDPDSGLEQALADVAADEPAAAENRHKLFVPLDHRDGAIAFCFLD